MLVLLSVLPVGALAEEAQQPAGELGAVYQWTDGEQGYALMETRDTLGGDEAGYSAAQTFSAPLGSYDDGSFTASSLPGRRPAMTSWPACFPNEILFRRGGGRLPPGADVRAGALQPHLDRLHPELLLCAGFRFAGPVYRSIYTDLCAAITALRYDQPGLLWLSDMRYGITWAAPTAASVTTRQRGFRLPPAVWRQGSSRCG